MAFSSLKIRLLLEILDLSISRSIQSRPKILKLLMFHSCTPFPQLSIFSHQFCTGMRWQWLGSGHKWRVVELTVEKSTFLLSHLSRYIPRLAHLLPHTIFLDKHPTLNSSSTSALSKQNKTTRMHLCSSWMATSVSTAARMSWKKPGLFSKGEAGTLKASGPQFSSQKL